MTIDIRPAGRLANGQDVCVIEMSNSFMVARFLNLGATLWQLVPRGHASDDGICLFHRDPLTYAHNVPYLGCTVGPLANRVANSTFTLAGRTHNLMPNEGPNHLHGGPTGFGHRVWEFATDPASNSVTFRLNRPDGEGGYPGNLDIDVIWTLEENSLRFAWAASADRATPVSLANHTYWNLAGTGTIEDHHLELDAAEVVGVDDDLIPTGVLEPIAGTPFDLSHCPRIGDAIRPLDMGGIDHCYALRPGSQAQLTEAGSGLRLEVESSLPGLQVYTGHQLDRSAEQGGYGPLSGLCLETQFFPDAINHPHFATPVVEVDATMRHWTNYTLHGISPTDKDSPTRGGPSGNHPDV